MMQMLSSPSLRPGVAKGPGNAIVCFQLGIGDDGLKSNGPKFPNFTSFRFWGPTSEPCHPTRRLQCAGFVQHHLGLWSFASEGTKVVESSQQDPAVPRLQFQDFILRHEWNVQARWNSLKGYNVQMELNTLPRW